MLSRGQRLKHRGMFARTMQQGQRLMACPYFMLLGQRHWQKAYLPAPECTTVRLGFVVSKKVHKRAVIRNRLRRQLKASWYQALPMFADRLNPWASVVVVVRNQALGQPFAVLHEALLQGLSRLPVASRHGG